MQDNEDKSKSDKLSSSFNVDKPKARKSLEELLAEAEEEFDLLDTVVDSTIKTLKFLFNLYFVLGCNTNHCSLKIFNFKINGTHLGYNSINEFL